MKLITGDKVIELIKGEYINFHDGRKGKPFELDTSICGIVNIDRAQELITLLITSNPRPEFTIASPQILLNAMEEDGAIEVLFYISDFTPIIKC